MSDPKVDGSNSDQGAAVRVDALLTEVKQMADRVENLLGGTGTGDSKPAASPPTATPAPSATSDSDSSTTATTAAVEGELAAEPSSPAPPAVPDMAEGGQEVPVDSGDDQVAEDEINEALDRLGKKDSEAAAASDAEFSDLEPAAQEALSGPLRSLLQGLALIDRPFLWVPRGIKDLLGYAGLATALLAIILWIIIGTSDK